MINTKALVEYREKHCMRSNIKYTADEITTYFIKLFNDHLTEWIEDEIKFSFKQSKYVLYTFNSNTSMDYADSAGFTREVWDTLSKFISDLSDDLIELTLKRNHKHGLLEIIVIFKN